jgi:inorganic triphosphatase YgiF
MAPETAMEEREIALVILPDGPDVVSQEICRLTELGGYRLRKAPLIVLRDMYWDLPDRDLGARRIALRLRMTDDRTWVTLKGPSKPAGDYGVRRLEIERPWSGQGLQEVLRVLDQENIHLERPATQEQAADAIGTMRHLGLKPIQDRETTRQPFDVLGPDRSDAEAIAELAIDKTRYRIKHAVVTLRQIEIESKACGGGSAAEAMAATLQQRYPTVLRPWRYGKLATGMALERLLDGSDDRDLLHADGTLDLSAYDRLATYLEGDPGPFPSANG